MLLGSDLVLCLVLALPAAGFGLGQVWGIGVEPGSRLQVPDPALGCFIQSQKQPGCSEDSWPGSLAWTRAPLLFLAPCSKPAALHSPGYEDAPAQSDRVRLGTSTKGQVALERRKLHLKLLFSLPKQGNFSFLCTDGVFLGKWGEHPCCCPCGAGSPQLSSWARLVSPDGLFQLCSVRGVCSSISKEDLFPHADAKKWLLSFEWGSRSGRGGDKFGF